MGKSKIVKPEQIEEVKRLLKEEVLQAERELALAEIAQINVAQERAELKEAKAKLEAFIKAYG